MIPIVFFWWCLVIGLAHGALVFTNEALALQGPIDPCDPSTCVATFTSYKAPIELPCSVASGHIPASPELPLLYPGNYDLCETFSFVGAHYCMIEAGPLFLPLLDPKTGYPIPNEAFYVGHLHLGKCVPKTCNAKLLRKRFIVGLDSTIKKIAKRAGNAKIFLPYLEAYMVNATRVRCVREEEESPGENAGSLFFLAWMGIMLACSVIGSAYLAIYPHHHNRFMESFSILHNVRSLYVPMQGDFVFLNGVRVLSMVWIVYGHTVLISTLGTTVPLQNPTAVDDQLQSFSMIIPRGAEYAVDTFFFMSGFLAVWGLLESTHSGRMSQLTPSSYLRMMVVRYIRLTPVYGFVMLFYIKMLPYVGTGPYWEENVGRHRLEEECKNSWTNLLYVNNLVPFSQQGGLGGCMGWTWYLANDFQFFLLAPLLAMLFYKLWSKDNQHSLNSEAEGEQQATSWLRLVTYYGPSVSLVIIQVAMTTWTMNKWEIQGTFDKQYSVHLYVSQVILFFAGPFIKNNNKVTPWCRISPYAIGCATAMYRFDRTYRMKRDFSELPPRQSLVKLFVRYAMGLLAFGIMLTITMSLYDDFRCKANPKSDCKLFEGFIKYGELAPGNWSHSSLTAYFALTYASWGIAIACLVNLGAEGYGGVIRDFLSHPVFTPLSRLTYNLYLVHIILLKFFFARLPAPTLCNQFRQVMDAIAFVVLGFAVAFLLYVFVEKPFTALGPIIMRSGKSEHKTGRNPLTMPLNSELNTVSDLDSEVVIMSSPKRRLNE